MKHHPKAPPPCIALPARLLAFAATFQAGSHTRTSDAEPNAISDAGYTGQLCEVVTRGIGKWLALCVATLALPLGASASIVFSGPANIAIPANSEGVYLNLETGGLTSYGGDWDVNLFYGGGAIGQSNTLSFAGSSNAVRNSPLSNLAFGSTVDASSLFFDGFSGSTGHMGTGSTPFENNVPGYLGFSINTGVGNNYGWMQVTLRDDGNVGTVHSWAWEDSGLGIGVGVGAVPEPSSTGVLGIVLLSAIALQRRRTPPRARHRRR